jgi:hypothetical protein
MRPGTSFSRLTRTESDHIGVREISEASDATLAAQFCGHRSRSRYRLDEPGLFVAVGFRKESPPGLLLHSLRTTRERLMQASVSAKPAAQLHRPGNGAIPHALSGRWVIQALARSARELRSVQDTSASAAAWAAKPFPPPTEMHCGRDKMDVRDYALPADRHHVALAVGPNSGHEPIPAKFADVYLRHLRRQPLRLVPQFSAFSCRSSITRAAIGPQVA